MPFAGKRKYRQTPSKSVVRTRKTTVSVARPRIRRYPRRTPRIKGPFRAYGGPDPFKPRMFARMRYTQTFIGTVGTAGIYGTEQVMRLNSLFDPDFTGAGHQPYGYDQVTQLYRKYLVQAVKIELIISDPSEDGLVFGAQIQPSSATYTIQSKTVDEIKEQPMSITRTINNSGKQVQRVVQYLPMSKLEGLSRVQWAASQDQYGAGVGTNPTLQPYLRFAVGNLRGTGSGNLIVRVNLTYYTMFWDRYTQSQS